MNVKGCVKGDRVVACFSPDYYNQFDVVMMAVFYAGLVLVPVAPADPTKTTENLKNIVTDAEPTVMITDRFYVDITKYISVGGFQWEVYDDIMETSDARIDNGVGAFPFALEPNDIAVLQYTSGSTSRPKGVCVTHSCILHNSFAIFATSNDRIMTPTCYQDLNDMFDQINNVPVQGCEWLPLYHDMGLMSNIFHATIRCQLVKSHPLMFLSKPECWLKMCSDYGACRTPIPAFAFSYCVRKAKEIPDLDLSSVKSVICGAEPINVEVLQQFLRRFSKYGLNPSAIMPAYGLAEGTLLVTGCKDPNAPPNVLTLSKTALAARQVEIVEPVVGAQDNIDFISCGAPPFFITVKIVDPDTCQEVGPTEIGEIWVRGPCVALGYWRLPHLTEETFRATLAGGNPNEHFLRTGDLGFLCDGELYCTGRIKDMIIIRGRNIYPHDIEQMIVDKCEGIVRPGCVAAFALSPQDDNELYKQEELCVVAEVYPSTDSVWNNLWLFGNQFPEKYLQSCVDAIRRATGNNVTPSVIVLTKPRTLNKTTSGKLQRSMIKQRFLQDKLANVVKVDQARLNKLGGPKSVFDLRDFGSKTENKNILSRRGQAQPDNLTSTQVVDPRLANFTHERVAKNITEALAAQLDVDPATIDPDQNMSEYNVDSISAVSAAQDLEQNFGFKVNPIIFSLHPTINALASYVVQQAHEKARKAAMGNIPRASARPIVPRIQMGQAKPQKAYIMGIGTANPDNPLPRDVIVRLLSEGLELNEKKAGWVQKVADSTTIEQRYSVRTPEELFWGNKGLGQNASFDERNKVYKQFAPQLAHESASRAIADWGGDKSKITHVISISCTGIIVPGLDFSVIKSLGLGTHVQRYSVLMMGCFGGVTGVKLARSIAAEDPNNVCLVVCCELCSLHLQLDDRSDNIIGACLFGDGSSSIIVGGSAIPEKEDDFIYEIVGYDSCIVPDTEEALIWDLGSSGWELGLSPEIPKIIHAHVKDFSLGMITPHLGGQKVDLDSLDWCLHPGGVAIVNAIEETCGLDSTVHSKATWDVLGRVGNMSSGTVYFVLDQLRKIGVTSDHTVMLAFGPGLNMEGAFLRNGARIPKRK